MEVVFDGLKAYVDATVESSHNAFYTSIGGRFYYKQAPQQATFPYCVHWYPNDAYRPMFVEEYENFIVQFDLYDQDTDASTILTAGDNLKTLFDDATPTITGYSVIYMIRDFAIPPDWDSEAGVWQYIFQYGLMIEKNRS